MGWLLLPVLFQTQATVGFGVGTVRFAGGSRLSVASVTPTLQLVSPSLESNFVGALAALPGGAWFAQGRAEVWGATAPLDDAWRLGGEGIWTGTTRSDDGRTAALHGVVEVLWTRPDWGFGVGAGPSAGWVSSDSVAPWVTALRTRARAWWSAAGASWAASIEPTHLLGAWFTDFDASVTIERGPVRATAWSSLRASHVYTSSVAASALVQLYASPSMALELGGGSYLRDPYQGFPRAGFVTAAIRLVHPSHASASAAEPIWPPLIPQASGGGGGGTPSP